MIAGLEGVLAAVAPDHVVINVGGVFYRVAMPGTAIASLGRIGDTVRVHTYLYVREDQLALYGGTSEQQLSLFESLLGVTGIGPKVALSELSCSFGPGVTGLLGPNGAGKTTLMRAITGLLYVH